jgi:hypothetical protein
MSVSVWFVLAPWLAFAAVLIGVYVWQRTSPRSRGLRRRAHRDAPQRSGPGSEQDPDLAGCNSTLS